MEAAATLRPAAVTILAKGLLIDGLVVEDRTAVELVRGAGDEGPKLVTEAIEIGARILDRESAGATVEALRTDLDRVTREAEAALEKRTLELGAAFAASFEAAFGAESGHVAKALERHFGEGSATAVQHRVREVMAQTAAKMQADLVRQFSASDGTNPLADFKAGVVRVQRQQIEEVVAVRDQLVALRGEVARLHAEKDKTEEVAAEHALSTAKGRPYEEAVFEAVEAIAGGHGDLAEAVGDAAGTGGRKGDVLVGLDGCAGPPRARIVLEAKFSQTGRKAALEYLDEAMAQRDAAYGIWVVPSEAELPAKTVPLREVNGDKLFVVYDPEDASRLALEVAYSLARARVLMAQGDADGLDGRALRAEVERALGALEDERRIKAQLTSATNSIADARKIVETMGAVVRGHLREIDRMVAAADGEDAPVPQPLL